MRQTRMVRSGRACAVLAALAVLILAQTGLSAVATYYVKTDGSDSNDGTSWDTAFATVKKGITAVQNASAGSVLMVGKGRYLVQGQGFTGGTGDNAFKTIRGATGDPADVILDGGGTTNVMQLARGVIVADLTITNGYNVGYSAVYASGIRAGATDRTEYIIVTNCIVTGCRNGSSGAAIYLRQSKHKVFDTVFRNNTSTAAYGSLKCIDNSTNLVVNCRFENNTARQGGGVYAQNATLECRECVFVGNTVTECGGGACVAAKSRATFDGCRFEGNTVTTNSGDNNGGGGLFLLRQTEVSYCAVSNCVFGGNVSKIRGGGMGCSFHTNAYATVYGCTFTNNVSAGHGGGICVYEQNNTHTDSPFTIRNCLFAFNGNNGSGNGGGVYAVFYGLIDSCTIVTNSSKKAGGGLYHRWGGTVTDCIIADNTVLDEPDDGNIYMWWRDTSGVNYRNCCFWPAPRAVGASASASIAFATANGCMTADPLFASIANSDFALTSRSPCRNKGENMAWMMAATDLAGNPRVSEDTVDIGCFEWLPIPGLKLLLK